jgi:hypothetical protein
VKIEPEFTVDAPVDAAATATATAFAFSPESEALDRLDLAGGAAARRAVPVVVAVGALIVAIIYVLRR